MFPPPPLPDLNNIAALSDEELLQLEGDERHTLEARIHCLQNNMCPIKNETKLKLKIF